MAASEIGLISTGEQTTAARNVAVPRSYYRGRDGEVRTELPPRDLREIIKSGEGMVWVDVDVTNRHQHAVLEKIFNFHPLAIEDTLNPDSRVKIEEYDGYLFTIIRGVLFDDKTENPYDLATRVLCFFLGPNFLVTTHAGPSHSCALIAERVMRSPDALERGPGRLMYLVMDASVDEYFPIIDQVDEFIDGLEERVFINFDDNALRSVFSVKRLVLSLRRHLAPQREVFNVLTNRPSPLLTHETQIYFRDIYDHVLRINDAFEAQRDLLGSTLDAYLTQVSNRLGLVTKGLSIIATLSVPFVVVSGMWGMNFERIPMARHPLGFWIMLALQLGIGGALIAILRWRKWL
ncbi:MAG: magnesium/cobalt transporter CorA [Anaerolineae bacterium]|nr:magnesium/cobalt transporter CorA [Gemmatimonadaceae bacterium]